VPLGLMRANSTGMSARACAERRIMLGLSQQQLAELIWVAYQQAHKYERGTNRMAAGRLYKAAQLLGVEVRYFFEELQRAEESPSGATPQRHLFVELARNLMILAPSISERSARLRGCYPMLRSFVDEAVEHL
jgi:transcriptional regulator with XRE-family HTH domain